MYTSWALLPLPLMRSCRRIKLLPVMWVSLHSKMHWLFLKCVVVAQVQSVRHTSIQACFLCFLSNPYMSPFIYLFSLGQGHMHQ